MTEESVTVGNGLYLPGRIGGNEVSFLVDTGSGVSEQRRNGSGAVPSPGRRGTGHCLCQQVAGGKRTEVLHGSQGAVGGGSGPQAL